ncbi:hypothetical protein LOK49_LG06G01855 [Camellia lanceoleosa]|uniref:Uncharacterized protein n=1 Tax=Camellia lanceoleosa TaxID=1840588 RepID=A0ACC0HCS4_9ERIC|nr:hypothetical protein LOK49_LG06G01855 [Camellia lanceoleosa]
MRDCIGSFMVAITRSLNYYVSPLFVEVVAIKEGLQLGLQLGVSQVVIKFDSQTAINMINGILMVSEDAAVVIHDIKQLGDRFHSCSFEFIRHGCNKAAHLTVKYGVLEEGIFMWTIIHLLGFMIHLWRTEDLSKSFMIE